MIDLHSTERPASGAGPAIVEVRAATTSDIAAIAQLVAVHVRQGHLLPRRAADIEASLATWIVATSGDTLVGCGALLQLGPDLVEVRSLAVKQSWRRSGIGPASFRRSLRRRAQDARRVLALTRAVTFFERQGFTVAPIHQFPEKVARTCVGCARRAVRDETALVQHFA